MEEKLKGKSSSKSPKRDRKREKKEKLNAKSPEAFSEKYLENSEEEIVTKKTRREIIRSGIETDDVMKMLKTVMESANRGIPLETQTLGQTGVLTETLPKEFIKDLETIQKDKIKFIGSKGGSSVMNATALTRRDKIHLVNLGLSKGLMDKELEGNEYLSNIV